MNTVVKIDVGRCLKALLKKWYYMLLVGIAIAAVLYLVKGIQNKTTYTASATIYSASYGSYSETTIATRAMQTYSQIISSYMIAERAEGLIGDESITAQEIRSMVYIDYEAESPILYILARSSSVGKSVAVVNAVAEAFLIEAQNITGGEGIRILDRASEEAVNASSSSDGKKMAILGFLVGFFGVACIIVLHEIFSDRVYRVEDATLGSMELLGIIPDEDLK